MADVMWIKKTKVQELANGLGCQVAKESYGILNKIVGGVAGKACALAGSFKPPRQTVMEKDIKPFHDSGNGRRQAEALVNKAQIKETLAGKGLNCRSSPKAIDAMGAVVHDIVKKSCQLAMDNGMKTINKVTLSPFK